MIQRVMPDLMGMKNIVVLNDEAHHCYRAKPRDLDDEEEELKARTRTRPRRTTKRPGCGSPASRP
jgi:type III restriction enzyme